MGVPHHLLPRLDALAPGSLALGQGSRVAAAPCAWLIRDPNRVRTMENRACLPVFTDRAAYGFCTDRSAAVFFLHARGERATYDVAPDLHPFFYRTRCIRFFSAWDANERRTTCPYGPIPI